MSLGPLLGPMKRPVWFKAKRRHIPSAVCPPIRCERGEAVRIRNNRRRMNYYHLAEEGYPIGSGEVRKQDAGDPSPSTAGMAVRGFLPFVRY